MVIKLLHKKTNKVYVLTYDSEGVLDTIQRDGEYIVSTHHVAKSLVANYEKISRGIFPNGFVKV